MFYLGFIWVLCVFYVGSFLGSLVGFYLDSVWLLFVFYLVSMLVYVGFDSGFILVLCCC